MNDWKHVRRLILEVLRFNASSNDTCAVIRRQLPSHLHSKVSNQLTQLHRAGKVIRSDKPFKYKLVYQANSPRDQFLKRATGEAEREVYGRADRRKASVRDDRLRRLKEDNARLAADVLRLQGLLDGCYDKLREKDKVIDEAQVKLSRALYSKDNHKRESDHLRALVTHLQSQLAAIVGVAVSLQPEVARNFIQPIKKEIEDE